ncbi:MAG: hypothetical protein OFPI_15290 [Osedax symbiont Rs2]|nr:MAG: hypothetical protein OFPI_15290 [Osedax symbiont Rs2]
MGCANSADNYQAIVEGKTTLKLDNGLARQRDYLNADVITSALSARTAELLAGSAADSAERVGVRLEEGLSVAVLVHWKPVTKVNTF